LIDNTEWILLDTETTGFKAPIFVVELAAQRMKGWETDGEPFRNLINQNEDIPPGAARVHGYTREILERDGELPVQVYDEFATYVGSRPLVAYNISYDLDDVLLPEWERLGLDPIGHRGFCAYHFAQRLLDPVPAGNCKLQTLRQYYRLPERGAHTGMGDVETVIDLFQNVLKPLADERGLRSWDDLVSYTTEDWFPSRIPFGKHKGRDFRDAASDPELRGWLDWLCNTSNKRSVKMGEWYLAELSRSEASTSEKTARPFPVNNSEPISSDADDNTGSGLVKYIDVEAKEYEQLIRFARSRLAELSSEYMEERRKIDVNNAALFRRVKDYYQKRDRLTLVIQYRRNFLDILLAEGEEEAEAVVDDFSKAQAEADQEYEEATKQTEDTKDLSDEEKDEIKNLFGKLVRLFHPDRYRAEPKKQVIYEKLITLINDARDSGDIKLLKEISNDPDAFIAKQGWDAISIDREAAALNLKKLYEAIEIEIVQRIEALSALRESSDYEVAAFCDGHPDRLDEIAKKQIRSLEVQIAELQEEADRLKHEVQELTGEDAPSALD